MHNLAFLGVIGVLELLVISGSLWWALPRVLRKAGYSGWWALTMWVPLLNLVMVWIFAFKRWPSIDGFAPNAGKPAA